jgi:hypothetical protein
MYFSQCHNNTPEPNLSLKGFALWSNRLSRLDHKEKNPFAILAALR